GATEGGQETAAVSITAPERTEKLDSKFSNPKDLGHILDADTSQALVISAVSEGKNIVVQGPPGTGKSQTIANIIATSVGAGKRVLFIAEKRAALEVVQKRLERCGLGPLCLELHSHKANRPQFYGSLKDTWDLDRPVDVLQEEYDKLRDLRDQLNRMAELVHAQDSITGTSAFRLMGRIAKLMGAGTPIANFDVPGIDTWSVEAFNQSRGMVRRFAEATIQHGSEYEHLWRGVENRLSPIDRQRLNEYFSRADDLFRNLEKLFSESLTLASLDWSLTASHINAIQRQLRHLNDMPQAVPDLFKKSVLSEHHEALLTLCQLLQSAQLAEEELSASVSSQAFEMEWEMHLNSMSREGSSFFRFLNGPYRQAVAALKSVSKVKLPTNVAQRLDLLQKLDQVGKLRRDINNQDSLGREFFGVYWKGFSTEYEESLQALTWISQQVDELDDIRVVERQVANLNADLDYAQKQTELGQVGRDLSSVWSDIVELTGLDFKKAFGSEDVYEFEIPSVIERFREWEKHPDELTGYHELLSAGELMSSNWLDEVRVQISSGKLPAESAEDTFTLLRSERVLKNILQEHPELKELSATDRSALVEDFKAHDENLRILAAREVMLKHYQDIPRGSAGLVGIVRGEIAKKRRHMPIRKLLDVAGDVVLALKPVFLMSPLSVAQYLKPNGINFDLLLIDEASQVKTSEALGCILRCKQVVVVGDQKQMPPTSFFDRQVSGEGDEEFGDDEAEISAETQLVQQSADMESILALCDARFGDRAMLSWHYRSEHPSLINVSNHEFYGGKLTYPPSPEFGSSISGMSFVHVKDGVYDRGKRRHNEGEAATICEYILEHIHHHPDWTLGVVALSMSQKNLIETRVEELCREHPEVEAYCDDSRDEPFFVKNLENVQGDERDVIFVSIGYGKDKDGYFGQGFGPVSSEGGERRLNVLFTRSRKRCVVFGSITHEEIRDDVSKHIGPRVLKRFMKYAATGDLDIAVETGEDMDSPFEEDVKQVVESFGHTVHPQVGASGFKIDLAVVDPDSPNHYLLAIECDGARYHSSSWARERDRLRQQVLEGKGWRFHRIWSTDWFYNRDTEIQKLVKAIEVAQEFFKSQSTNGGSGAVPDQDTPGGLPGSGAGVDVNESEKPALNVVDSEDDAVALPQEDIVERAPAQAESTQIPAYEEATVGNLKIPEKELIEVDINRVTPLVEHVVNVEGPVHQRVIATRVANMWGYRKLGRLIRERIEQAIQHSISRGQIVRSSSAGVGFLDVENKPIGSTMRNRAKVELALVKQPDYIPSSELREAITTLVRQNLSLSLDECVKETQKLLGTNLRRAEMKAWIELRARELDGLGEIRYEEDQLRKVN
ncbi:MAG: DUF3320 domain-containing protein, partial [Gammaproteobacteria bacterium]|nr:DUF3320 domain-containing protein [Gammaproteobacteria bacterium]